MNSKDFGKVAVLMGGPSAEREVSLKSGNAVLQALLRRGVNAHGIDAGADVLTQLALGGFDRVFIALHGRWGEDGVIQGALEVLALPYTGSGVLGSALGMDKLACKRVWAGCGIPSPAYEVLTQDSDLDTVVERLGLPLMVKPTHEGSSLGMSKVRTREKLPAALALALDYDRSVFAERCIEGMELTAALVDEQVLPLIRLETPREFYDYQAKYFLDDTRYICPCGLAPEAEHAIQLLAREAFEVVGGGGWGRVDIMLDAANEPYVLEVNTVPGMTDHSLVPMAARHAGLSFEDLVLRILAGSGAQQRRAPGGRHVVG
jgi:D-alanine-D-alanine ligase